MSSSQILKLARKLELTAEQERDFLDAMQAGNRSRSALVITPKAPEGYRPPLPAKDTPQEWGHSSILALPSGEAETKPGSLPDYECGYYYPLDLSSVWETAPLAHLPFRPERCLDMCAAPGGKSILAQTRVSPQEHVSNEVNPKRLGILRHNLLRCGFTNLYTQRLRPDQWAELAPGCFDLILADAPCSGQSLLAKGIPNPGCFNSSVTGGNAKRQRGILLAALRCLAPGGFLLYTTCTYAPEENERNVLYLLNRHPDLHTVTVPELEHFRSSLTQEACYRLMPFHGAGAGGFTCLLRKEGGHPLPLSLPDELKAWPIHAMNC